MFETYLSLNLQVIPIIHNTKRPFFKDWYNNYDPERCEQIFQNHTANYGLLLGRIVDVEGDTLEANNLIHKLTKNIKHPTFRSNKSYHHLFLNPDPNLTVKKFNGIEFRGYKHQSILPPSKVKNQHYSWINMHFPIPEMPDSLKLLYYRNTLKPNFKKIFCPNCKKIIFIHEKRLAKEQKLLPWFCKKCRPLLINTSKIHL